jgi:hypothetical protein
MIKAASRTKGDLFDLLILSGGFISAMDGLWFLAVKEAHGDAEAMRLDLDVRERYAHLLAKRVRRQLEPSGSGIEMVRQVIEMDPSFLANEYEISHLSKDRMFLRVNRCVVLEAMERSGRKELLCEATTGSYFRSIARELEAEVSVHPIKLPPRNSPDEACCEWLFESHPPFATGKGDETVSDR